jgi:alanyl-tRNA synthetase
MDGIRDDRTKRLSYITDMFREFYGEKGYIEIKRRSLVSRHDLSIRFTNSTTSVMKPYFTDGRKLDEKIMLIQPALGFQGINYWEREKGIGCFSSYFFSFGVMCEFTNLEELVSNSIEFFADVLRIDMCNFFVQLTVKDIQLCDIFKQKDVNVCKDLFQDKYYLHQFGIDGVIGKTACYTIFNNDEYRYIGSIIIIEQQGVPIAIEHSFDSTLFLAALKRNGHPVLEMSGAKECYEEMFKTMPYEERLVLIDFLNVYVVLKMEGLNPSSRGRGGNLRKIIKLISEIVFENRLDEKLLRNAVSLIYDEEYESRKGLTERAIDCCNKEEVVECLINEIERLRA